MAPQAFEKRLNGLTPWIDLVNATPEEIKVVEAALGIELPTREEMKEIESTSQFYCEQGARFMTTPLLVSTDSDSPQSTEIGFVLVRGMLLTLRDSDPLSIRQPATWVSLRPAVKRDQILIEMLESIIDRQADLLERISKETEEPSQRIFTCGRRNRKTTCGRRFSDWDAAGICLPANESALLPCRGWCNTPDMRIFDVVC